MVGLLAAQSLVNEGISKVLYVCATNDLVIQTSREITAKLGFTHTTRMGGQFSNNLYSTGQGFCLTNYQALFNSRTTFRGDRRQESIIFDDAHVAEKIIRDSFTVRIEQEELPGPYLAGLDKFRNLYEETIQMLYAVQRLNPLERYAEIDELSTRAEWQPAAIFEKLRSARLMDVKR